MNVYISRYCSKLEAFKRIFFDVFFEKGYCFSFFIFLTFRNTYYLGRLLSGCFLYNRLQNIWNLLGFTENLDLTKSLTSLFSYFQQDSYEIQFLVGGLVLDCSLSFSFLSTRVPQFPKVLKVLNLLKVLKVLKLAIVGGNCSAASDCISF